MGDDPKSAVEDEAETSDNDSDGEVDRTAYERQRVQLLQKVIAFEQQFLALKKELYDERMAQVSRRKQDILDGVAADYRSKVAELEQTHAADMHYFATLKNLQLTAAERRLAATEFELRCELDDGVAAERRRLADRLRAQIDKLKAEKRRADVRMVLWQSGHSGGESPPNVTATDAPSSRCKSSAGADGNRRPTSSAGSKRKRRPPVVVHMLPAHEIDSDWWLIKRAVIESELDKDDSSA